MIGYIAPFKPELKYKEMAVYSAYYCTLCKHIHKLGGRFGCLCLCHDITSLALLLSSIETEQEEYISSRCVVSPIKKIVLIKNKDHIFERAAALNILLFYHKNLDDISDHITFKAIFIKLLLSNSYRRISRHNQNLNELIKKQLKEYYHCEISDELTCEAKIDPYAILIATVVSIGIADRYTAKNLEWLGYHLAKTVCIIDAIDDFNDDCKKRCPNILRDTNRERICALAVRNEEQLSDRIGITQDITDIIQYSIQQICLCLAMLPLQRNIPLIDNIFEFGIRNTFIKLNRKERNQLSDSVKASSQFRSTPSMN